MFDKKPKVCGYCGCAENTEKKEIYTKKGGFEEVFSRNCASCENLLYGYSKPLNGWCVGVSK